MATCNGFILLTATCRSVTIKRRYIVAFALQKWSRKRATMSRYTYVVYLVKLRVTSFQFHTCWKDAILIPFLHMYLTVPNYILRDENLYISVRLTCPIHRNTNNAKSDVEIKKSLLGNCFSFNTCLISLPSTSLFAFWLYQLICRHIIQAHVLQETKTQT
jgi:hypothetical protein